MTLYEMTEAARQLYEMLSSGEIDEQTVTDTMEGMLVTDKLEGYCQVIRQFEADAAAYKVEKEFFEAKQRAAEATLKRLENAVTGYMNATDSDKIRAGLFEIKRTHGKAVKIIDEAALGKEYFDPQPDKLNRSNIRKDLLAGIDVAGAILEETVGVKIK